MRRTPLLLAISATCMVGLCAIILLTFDHGRDQSIYALVADVMVKGGLPYRDAWDFKPPGIFAVYALAQTLGGGTHGIRTLEALSLLGNAAALVTLSRWHFRRASAGYLAAVIASLVHVQLDFWHTAQPETFGATVILVAFLVLGPPRSTRGSVRICASGLFLGLAFLLKPPLAGAGLAVVVYLTRTSTQAEPAQRSRAFFRSAGLVFLGGVLPTLGVFALYRANGAWSSLTETFVHFTPMYTRLSWVGQNPLTLVTRATRTLLFNFSYTLPIGFASLTLVAVRKRLPPFVQLCVLTILLQLVGIAMQAKFFPYHFGGLIPLAALLAAYGWMEVWANLEWRMTRYLAAILFGMALLGRSATVDVPGSFVDRTRARLALLMNSQQKLEGLASWEALASVSDVSASHNRRAGEWLAKHLAAQKPRTREPQMAGAPRNCLYVWGFEPEIYLLAGLEPCSRYIYNIPQRVSWSATWARPELLATLEHRRPVAVVVVTADPMWQVTGNGRDSAASLTEFEALKLWLDANYRPVRPIGDHTIYLRNDLSPSNSR